MADFPLSYLLLVALIGLAAPLLLRTSPRQARWMVAGALAGLGLASLGLMVLAWSVTACWVLVGAGVCALTAAATPQAPFRAAALAALPSAAAGLVFEATPGDGGLLLYVGFAAPALLAGALALMLARWLRWEGSREGLAAGGALLAFATLAPASMAFFDLLRSFEVVHAPVLLAGLGALVYYVRRGAQRAAHAHAEAQAAPSIADYLALPAAQGPRRVRRLAWAACGTALVAGVAPFLVGGEAWLALGLGLACVVLALAARRRPEPAAALAAGVALLVGLDIAAGSGIVRHVLAVEGPAPRVILALGVLAATTASLALAVSIAAWRERRAREAAAEQRAGVLAPEAQAREGLPTGTLVERIATVPGPDGLAAFAGRLADEGRAAGLLLVRAPAGEPLWTVPEPSYAWLSAQRAAPRVHVGVEEDGLVFFVPPVLPGEGAA